jgi:ketosteroid isomerase-like protein
MVRSVICALLLAASGGCASARGAIARPPLAENASAALASLVAAERALGAVIEAQGMSAALPGAMADDVRFLAPGRDLMQGRADGAAWLASDSVSAVHLRWTPIQAGVSADGRAGYTFGAAEGTRTDGSVLHWRYISFWRRGMDGAWRMEAHVGMPAGGAPAAAPAGWRTLEQGIPVGSPSERGAAEVETMMQADRDFAALASVRSISEAFAAYAAPWGVVATDPDYGPEQIGRPGRPGVTLVWGPVLGGIADSGDLGWTIGTATVTYPNPDGTSGAGYSKYLSVWQRQMDGSWRYVVDGGNARPAPPAP